MEPHHPAASIEDDKPLEYNLRKYLLLLATLVATVTSAAGFNPPGGVWQGSDDGHLVGDPIIRSNHYIRYLVFFYCNATTLALSLVVILLVLLLAILIDMRKHQIKLLAPLRVVMVLDLLGLLGAYIAGTCWDVFTTMYTMVLVAAVAFYIVVQMVVTPLPEEKHSDELKERPRKVLMLLATFATSITYMAGLSTPGGFWDSAQEGHRPGDPVLQEDHSPRLRAFFICNTTAFIASLLIIVLLLVNKLRESIKIHPYKMYGCIIIALISLMGAYAIGSCRETDNTIYVCSLGGAILAYIFFQVVFRGCVMEVEATQTNSRDELHDSLESANELPEASDGRQSINSVQVNKTEALDKARSLVLLLATLASTITYQAALDPPGGLWQDNQDGHKAGDPILLSMHPGRYKVFFYCNSTAFVASLVVIILVQYRSLVKRHALETAMIMDLFGLIGAYASGSCRDTSTSIYAIALAGAVLIYVVIHVVFFTLDHQHNKPETNKLVDKRRKRLLLFAILATTITYQAGLTPPSRFWPQDDEFGHKAGDPILFSNYPRRYKAFFYCNSVSFMSSIALIILLVNPNLYRPAIRSYALSVCTAAGLLGIVGAYAAGSTQHLKTSIYIFILVAVVLSCVILLLLLFLVMELKKMKRTKDTAYQASRAGEEPRTENTEERSSSAGKDKEKKKLHAEHKYLMLLGILAASITYQAGLNPPGGVWQNNTDGHAAGDPVMHDNRRLRYIAFFYSNSTSFMASIVVIILLLPRSLQEGDWRLNPLKTTIVLDLLGLLVAYASGSSRKWETSGYVIALVTAVLGFVAIHILVSLGRDGKGDVNQYQSQQESQENGQPPHLQQQGNAWHQVHEA